MQGVRRAALPHSLEVDWPYLHEVVWLIQAGCPMCGLAVTQAEDESGLG